MNNSQDVSDEPRLVMLAGFLFILLTNPEDGISSNIVSISSKSTILIIYGFNHFPSTCPLFRNDIRLAANAIKLNANNKRVNFKA